MTRSNARGVTASLCLDRDIRGCATCAGLESECVVDSPLNPIVSSLALGFLQATGIIGGLLIGQRLFGPPIELLTAAQWAGIGTVWVSSAFALSAFIYWVQADFRDDGTS